jgi:hypothetical protein
LSYGFDLVRLPAAVDRNEAYQRLSDLLAEAPVPEPLGSSAGPLDREKEERKQRLVAALIARDPHLKVFQRDHANIARRRSISEDDARRLFRDIELNDHQHSIQITLFDDEAGVSYSFAGDRLTAAQAARTLLDCLEVLESEGGFSTYDAQLALVLDLRADHDLILDRLSSSGSATNA